MQFGGVVKIRYVTGICDVYGLKTGIRRLCISICRSYWYDEQLKEGVHGLIAIHLFFLESIGRAKES